MSQFIQGFSADLDAAGTTPVIEVSVVLPCLNERETVGICVLEAAGLRGEVIVADNGSTDGSTEIARSAGAKLVQVEQRGYGNALKGGIQAARGVYVVMADSDDSYDFGHIPRFIEQLRNGSDLVMGNRFRGGIHKGAMPLLHRYLGNPVLTALGRLFFVLLVRISIADCGPSARTAMNAWTSAQPAWNLPARWW
ncbi:MAG: glycosyltransferase family 2 protein [Candidatus Sulfotelmatobacter sp.]|jgi:glycosyltransferase involved in cell wall biosynthesis